MKKLRSQSRQGGWQLQFGQIYGREQKKLTFHKSTDGLLTTLRIVLRIEVWSHYSHIMHVYFCMNSVRM